MVYVELDEKGRLVLPKAMRERAETTGFEVLEGSDRQLILMPVLPRGKLRGAFRTGATPEELKKIHDIEKTRFP